jgi:hypothetical protein
MCGEKMETKKIIPYKKLDQKIKELNSTRVFKKVTPKGDLSWYVKWISSAFILSAVACRSTGNLAVFDLWLSLIGTSGWFWVGMLWHDRALIMLNGALASLLLVGLLNYFI